MSVTLERRHVAHPRSRVDPVQVIAQRQLRESAYYSIRSVRCDFHEGVLTLRGCLATYYLKQVAQTLVAKVEGVQLINNRVEVPEPSVRS